MIRSIAGFWLNNDIKLRIISSLLILSMIFIAAKAVTASTEDTQNHWAQKSIDKWVSQGLVQGYPDGTFKPDNSVTRAEFMTMVNRAFGYTEESGVDFVDVAADDWFYQEVAKAKAVGYLSGYPDGTIKPKDTISRQEAAVILAKILRLEKPEALNILNKFHDSESIPAWSKSAVAAVVANNYMAGYPDQTYQPTKSITRAEAITMLDGAMGLLLDTAGIYEIGNIQGNVTINTTGVTLKNSVITGNLYLTEGIGNGEVELENVTILGETLISGGGENSIIVKDSSLQQTKIDKPTGKVRVVAKGNTIVEAVTLKSPVRLEATEATEIGFKNILVSSDLPANTVVQLAGNFSEVGVAAANSQVELLSGTIANLKVAREATRTSFNIARAAIVTKMELNAAVNVAGQGAIQTLSVKISGSTFEQTPSNIILAAGTTVKVGDKEVAKNTTTTPAVTTPINLGGGGSSNGSSGSPTTSPATVAVSAINITGEAAITTPYGTLQMSAAVLPGNATNKNITWSVENTTGTAVISSAGLLRATGNGQVTVIATAQDGSGIVGSRAITVSGQEKGKVGDLSGLNYVLTETNVETIIFAGNIAGNINASRLMNIDFDSFTLTGDVTINSTDFGTITLSGTAGSSITGDLSVNAGNATINNNISVGGNINIEDVSSSTWNQSGNANKIVISDSDEASFNFQTGAITNGVTIAPTVPPAKPILLKGNLNTVPIRIEKPAKLDIAPDAIPPAITIEENAADSEIENMSDLEVEINTTAAITVGGKAQISAPEGISIVEKPGRPVATPPPGNYIVDQNITLSSRTEDVVIYYTIDRDEPVSVAAAVYYDGNSISIARDTIIRAIAVKNDEQSTMATYRYQIDKSTAAIELEEVSSKTAGQPFNISIIGAKDRNGDALQGDINVTVANANSEVYSGNTSFTDGSATLSITLTTPGVQTLRVNINGVTNSQDVPVNVEAVNVDNEIIKVENITATNGSIIVVLSGVPETTPTADDFQVQKINHNYSATELFDITDMMTLTSWNATTKTLILEFAAFEFIEETEIEVFVSYNSTAAKSDTLIVSGTGQEQTPLQPLTLSSVAFSSNNSIPNKYTMYGENTSIPLAWANVPEGTQSFVLIMYDEHQIAGNWIHWAVVNIPAEVRELGEGASRSNMPAGSKELKNTFAEFVSNDPIGTGYAGPQPPFLLDPPFVTDDHTYKIIIYALNTPEVDLNETEVYELADFENAISGKLLGKGEIAGTYSAFAVEEVVGNTATFYLVGKNILEFTQPDPDTNSPATVTIGGGTFNLGIWEKGSAADISSAPNVMALLTAIADANGSTLKIQADGNTFDINSEYRLVLYTGSDVANRVKRAESAAFSFGEAESDEQTTIPTITGYSLHPGDEPDAAKIIYTPAVGNSLKIVVHSGLLTVPEAGAAVPVDAEAYFSGMDMVNVAVGQYVRLYEIDGEEKIVKFADILLTEDDVAVAAQVIGAEDYTVAPGSQLNSTRITYTPDNGNSLRIITADAEASLGPTMLVVGGSIIGETSEYNSGEEITGVTAGWYIRLYEVDGNDKIVKYVDFRLVEAQIKFQDDLPAREEIVEMVGQQWNWIYYNENDGIEISEGSVEITAGEEHDFNNAPRLTKEISGDFTLISKVGFSDGNSVGLLVDAGNNSFIRFAYDGWVYDNSESRLFEGFRFELISNGEVTAKVSTASQVRTYLRLVRSGDQFTAYARHDKENIWRKIYEVTVDFPDQIKAGVYLVANTPANSGSFSEIKLQEGKPYDADIAYAYDVYSAIRDREELSYISELVKAGVNLNNAIPKESPVYIATFYGDLDVLDTLLKAGAETDFGIPYIEYGPGNFAGSPLWLAVAKGDYNTAEALLKAGADPNFNNFFNAGLPLVEAAYQGDVNMVQLLLQYGADPNKFENYTDHGDPSKWRTKNALMAAVKYPQIVEVLLQWGANPVLEDYDNKTALDYAQDPEEGNAESADKIKARLPKPAFYKITPVKGTPGEVLAIWGENFRGSTQGTIWFDLDGNEMLDDGEPKVSVNTTGSGRFSNVQLIIPENVILGGMYAIIADFPQDGEPELIQPYYILDEEEQLDDQVNVAAINQSYLDSFGRIATEAEVAYWSGRLDWQTKDDLVALHRNYIKVDFGTRVDLVKRSYEAVFWRGPEKEELNYWVNRLVNSGENFNDLVEIHKNYIEINASFRETLIVNSYRVVFGHDPSSAELGYWSEQLGINPLTYKELVALHRNTTIKGDQNAREITITNAYHQAFGRSPNAGEIAFWSEEMTAIGTIYSEMIDRHRDYVKINSGTRDQMIRDSYLEAFQRQPLQGEYDFWRPWLQSEGMLYFELINAHQNWIANNKEVLQANTALTTELAKIDLHIDLNSGNLVKTSTGAIFANPGYYVVGRLDAGGNIIATGGGNIIATGGGNIIAAGGGNIIAAGGGNIIATGGGNIVPNGIQLNSAGIISTGGGN